MWALTLLTGLPLALWLNAVCRARMGAKRSLSGRCLRCGYDLRASTDKCPECGTPVPAKPEPPGAAMPSHSVREHEGPAVA